MTTKNHRPYTPEMTALIDALKTCYRNNCIGMDGDKTDNQVALVEFMTYAFAHTGLKREIYLCSGKFDEITEAWKQGAVHNPCNSGPDMKIPASAGNPSKTIELKTAHTGWDVKANFSFSSPEVDHGETKPN